MNLQYSNRRDLEAECPKCRRKALVLVTATGGKKSKDFLACTRCKVYMFVDEFKEKLFTV
ncbi:MAG: hypothetical protein ACO2Y5_00855 [Nitrosopumilaceae archaeon]